jgi:hypothetical protein
MKLSKRLTFVINSTALALFALFPPASLRAEPTLRILSVQPTAQFPSATGSGFSVAEVTVTGGLESRCYLHGHHFLSIVRVNGTYNVRPHPGVDANGWGSSLYLQAFLPDAGPRSGTVNSVVASTSGMRCDRIRIVGSRRLQHLWLVEQHDALHLQPFRQASGWLRHLLDHPRGQLIFRHG